jgi:hypothetical protein
MYINSKFVPSKRCRPRLFVLYKPLFLCIFRNAAYAERWGTRRFESPSNRESDMNFRPKLDLDIHFRTESNPRPDMDSIEGDTGPLIPGTLVNLYILGGRRF